MSSQSETPSVPCPVHVAFVPSTAFIPRFRTHSRTSSLSNRTTTRRPRPTSCPVVFCTEASIPDDDFFLPLDDLNLLKNSTIHGTTSSSANQTSLATKRVNAKRLQISRNTSKDRDDEDETLRSQIVDEKLSAADLFGTVDAATSPAAPTSPPHLGRFKPQQQKTNESLLIPQSPSQNARVSSSGVRAKTTTRKPQKRTEPQTTLYPARRNASGVIDISATRQPKRKTPSPLPSDDATVRPGDLVSHSRHGIGRFRGVERTVSTTAPTTPGAPRPLQEYAVIEYRDGDVYVPFSHFEVIRRLSDLEMQTFDRLDTISGSATYYNSSKASRSKRSKHVARERTRAKIRKQLINLHGLYAERTTIERPPFPVDEEAEQRFNLECGFVLTEDQEAATKQIMRDMSKNRRPMDRLLCGDVGFGKTEVAVRAAFRVLAAGKQVAILAPTTILAQQHYDTFRSRFEGASVKIAMACMTRFTSRKINIENRDRVCSGEVRVAIGTHMLLNDKCIFPDLGLLIVDEEHRFGVNQKEKIRARYRGIDALFMSATPIPRTLHLTLSGLRDASVLRTPPPGRKPVITKVSPSGAGIVRAAITREVERGGQVFFVVPRIEGIEALADWVRDLFPGLKVLVAHGSINDLEHRIWAFAQKEYDVLVCTTIIENGINMPDVNTIIVQDAGKFGLAQLHQLRGRVGRSDVQAYAFLLYASSGACQAVHTLDRLRALERYSDLGAGFAIAQRDMEMRGVGTILGVEQHGNNSIEGEEYAMMLSEELEHARTGKPIPVAMPNPVTSTEVYLPIASLIPADYITDFDQKMTAYGQLSRALSMKAVNSVVKGLESRYGPLPTSTRRHVSVMELKLSGKPLGITRIFAERQHVILEWPIDEPAFNCLVAFLPDKQSRDRCEHKVDEERVIIRGLGICSGDVQLAKLRVYLNCFNKAASGLLRQSDRYQPDPTELVDTLHQIEADKE
ncbi:unnamed protein product [Chondrus crispus]|uniref:Transcription-repair coupling factor n=1 Tax=Chondrus crispus TaxID=2769 RepID=R7Q730_CHOCR|nr:unnamed protein product [Chondrus crispus]CDF33186.1 unnamed protein product [Chondrus crispus]|eukprot:XP_005712989.1 unnamed protein product [Chondrus crispus]